MVLAKIFAVLLQTEVNQYLGITGTYKLPYTFNLNGLYCGGYTRDLWFLLEWNIFLFTFVRPNIYSTLSSKTIEGCTPVVLASLIEGHRCI